MADSLADKDSVSLSSPLGDDGIALSIDDLLPDANGNVVLFNDAGVSEMSIVSERPVVNSGIVGEGAPAASGDMAGMAFYSFDSGPTLYCPIDLHISIVSDTI